MFPDSLSDYILKKIGKMIIAQFIILVGSCLGDGRGDMLSSIVTDPTLRFNDSCSDIDKDNAKTCEESCLSQFESCIDRSLEPEGQWSEND